MRVPLVIQWLINWQNLSLQRKLVFWSIGFWVITMTILSLSFLLVGQREIMNQTRQRNVQLASIISRDVNAQIGGMLSDVRVVSRHLESLSPELENQAAALLAVRLSAPQRYRAIYYFDSTGSLLFHLADSLENLISLKSTSDILLRPAVTPDEEIISAYSGTKGTVTFISDAYITGIDRIPVVSIAVPVRFSENLFRVAVLQLDLSDIWRRIQLSTIGKTGFTYATSKGGVVIAHPEPDHLGLQLHSQLAPLLSGFEGFTEYADAAKGRMVFAAYSPVGGSTGWGIIVEQERSETNAPLLRIALIIIGIWLILGTSGTLGILVMTRNFVNPIAALTRTAQSIAQTGKLARTELEQRHDEVGQLSRAFDEMIYRLQATEGKLATAAIEERNRLARDLHDAVSQTLFSASLIAEVLPRLWERNPEEGRRRLEEVRQLTRGALAEMRTLLLELRPAALVEAELPHLLRQLGESVSGRSRVPVKVLVEGDCDFPAEAKVALYRIAQEALNNVAKHAGAKQATTALACMDDKVTLTIRDDGRGFDIASIQSDSLGLGIMRERAAEIGALLSMKSNVGQGTEIMVIWTRAPAEVK